MAFESINAHVLDEGERIKGPWSPEEDTALQKLVDKYGPRNWSIISKGIPGRSGKSCRLRWCNQLSPQVEHRPFSTLEDARIIEAHGRHGNKWATIAKLFPGRTDNAIKNHWNSTLRRRCLSEGHMTEESVTVYSCKGPRDDGEICSHDGRKRNNSNEGSSDGSFQEDGNWEVESRRLKKVNFGSDSPSRSDISDPTAIPCHQVHKPVARPSAFNCYNSRAGKQQQEALSSGLDPPTFLSLSLPGSTNQQMKDDSSDVSAKCKSMPVACNQIGVQGLEEKNDVQGACGAVVNKQPATYCAFPFPVPAFQPSAVVMNSYLKAEDALVMMNAAVRAAVAQALAALFPSAAFMLQSPAGVPVLEQEVVAGTMNAGLLAVMKEMIAKEVQSYMLGSCSSTQILPQSEQASCAPDVFGNSLATATAAAQPAILRKLG